MDWFQGPSQPAEQEEGWGGSFEGRQPWGGAQAFLWSLWCWQAQQEIQVGFRLILSDFYSVWKVRLCGFYPLNHAGTYCESRSRSTSGQRGLTSMLCLTWRKLPERVKSRRLISRNPRSSILTGGWIRLILPAMVTNSKMNRHANAEEAEKEEFSAKFKQAKVTFSVKELIE